jgi:hypothetical protein
MQKLKSALLAVNVGYLLVLGLAVKALITDVPLSIGFITLPILGFEAYKSYLKSKQPDPVRINVEVQRELDNMKAKLNAMTLERSAKPQPTRYF